jgi:AraC-like DNA-binding protein
MNDANDFATVRFSTDDLPEKDRVAMWREQFGYAGFGVDIEPAEDRLFQSAIASRHLPGLSLVLGTMSPARISRTHKFLADGNDDLTLVVNFTGAATLSARGREVVLRERDAVLVSGNEVTTFERFSPGRTFSLRIPRSILSPLVTDIDDAVMRHVTRQSEALKLLIGYSSTLLDDGPTTSGLRRLVVSHIHDLIALTLGATRDAAGAAQDLGVRAARLSAAKTYIVENSGRRDLSIGTVAAHLGVSPRYLQMLFEMDGSTFSAFLLNLRLTRAHRMLCTPQFDRRAVGAIAYDVGFGDLSYFNRCFRRIYGLTPSDIREATAKG